ncbi:MAG: hypothetical protein KGM18_05530 [Sphingomonadales bacterium]|nr:hypothetical protein [Sphingomonadales bacterium]
MRRVLILSCLVLSACANGDDGDQGNAERDPVAAAALSDPLLADPDLATQNQGGAALTGGGPASAEIPPDKRTKDEIDAATAAARQLAGGTIPAAPTPAESVKTSRLDKAVTAPAIARALGVGSAACAERMDYTALWAARLSAPFEIYPRGHVGQSAGSDVGGCRLRVVGFVTPVAVDDVVAFYAARSKAAGFAARLTGEGDDMILQGGKGTTSYAIAARARDDRMTEVVLATSGI